MKLSHTHIHVHTRARAHMHAHTHARTHTSQYTHASTQAHTHTHTHKRAPAGLALSLVSASGVVVVVVVVSCYLLFCCFVCLLFYHNAYNTSMADFASCPRRLISFITTYRLYTGLTADSEFEEFVESGMLSLPSPSFAFCFSFQLSFLPRAH